MLVQMKFHAELDDVPHEVERLIEDILNKDSENHSILLKTLNEIRNSGGEGMLRQFGDLQQLVGKALKITARIEDILGLIQGYHSAKTNPPQPEVQATPELSENKSEGDDKLKGNPNIEDFKDS